MRNPEQGHKVRDFALDFLKESKVILFARHVPGDTKCENSDALLAMVALVIGSCIYN